MRQSLLLALICLCLNAQQSGPQHFKCTGTVLDAVTGAPVVAAEVVVTNPQNTQHTSTGSDGRFEFDEVTAGDYYTRVKHAGYAEAWQVIHVDSVNRSLTVKIEPISRISGHVIDEEGLPVESVDVQAFVRSIQSGREFWQPGMSTQTDSQGHYSMDLRAGVYYIRTLQTPLYPAARPNSEASRHIYPEAYSPSASDRESAQRITAAPGIEAIADIALKSVRGVKVSVVADAQHFQAYFSKGDSRFATNQTSSGDDGAVHFAAVPPGDWTIYANGDPPDNRRGSASINVQANDISPVRVSLLALADIPVVLSGSQKNANVALQLISNDDLWSSFPQTQPNGDQAFLSVPPGTYQAAPLPGSVCIASLSSGGTDLLQNPLIVSAGATPPPIVVSLADKCPSFDLSTKSGEIAQVVVVGTNGALPQPVFIGGVHPQKVSFAPGRYRFYAFQDVSGVAYADPQVLRSYEGQDVEVINDDTQSVVLDVVNKAKP